MKYVKFDQNTHESILKTARDSLKKIITHACIGVRAPIFLPDTKNVKPVLVAPRIPDLKIEEVSKDGLK